jgi:hypothetical protein
VQLQGGFHLSDPDGHATFALQRGDRVLTGGDFDPESIVRAPDGTYWIGEEFGPSLLHVDDAGRLLQAPVLLPDGVSSPDDQWSRPANLKSSKGVEAMVTSPDGRYLYPLLEGTVTGDPEGTTRMYEFDRTRNEFTDRGWRYRLDRPNHATGDAVAVDEHRLLVIERDNGQAAKAVVKKVYLLDRRVVEPDGTMRKALLVDLLNVGNPRRVGAHADPFRMPFQCIEGIVLLDERTLLLVNDNNFPSDAGRVAGVPDDNEFATIVLPESLDPDLRSPATPRP